MYNVCAVDVLWVPEMFVDTVGITIQTFLHNIKFVNQKICKVYIKRFIDSMSGLNQEYGWFIRDDRHLPPCVSCPRSHAKVDYKHKTIG